MMDAKETNSDNSDGDIYEMVNNPEGSCGGSFEFVGSEESYDRMADFEENYSKMHITSPETGVLDMEFENTNDEDVDMITKESETHRNMAELSGSDTDVSTEKDQNINDGDDSIGYEEDSDMMINDPRSQDSSAYFQTRLLEYPAKFKRTKELDLKDIIGENALRFLPAKSVFRFRSVSREWYDKISRPVFPYHQSTSFRSTSGYFTKTTDFLPSFFSLSPTAYGVPTPVLNFLPEPVSVRSSSNGLLLCQGYGLTSSYYVCNPATRKFHLLPVPGFYHGEPSRAVLAFEPSNDLYFETPYVVICPFTPPEADVTFFEIYSSVTKTWRLWDADYIKLGSEIKDTGFYADGTSYWETKKGFLLVFHMKYEVCSVEPLPYGSNKGTLCFLEGDLCRVTSRVGISGCVIFVRKAVDMSMKHTINAEVPLPLKSESGKCRVLPPCVNDDTLCCILGTGAFHISLKDGGSNLVRMDEIPWGCDEFVPYVNSLVPLEESD